MTAITPAPLALRQAEGNGLSRWLRRRRSLLLRLLGLAVWLGAWQLCASLGVIDVSFSSSPSRVASALVSLFKSGDIFSPLGATFSVLAIGLGITIVAGIPLGLLVGLNDALYEMADPLLNILYAMPFVLFLPVIIFWFGIEQTSIVVIVIWAGVMPLIINVRAGARGLAREYRRVAAVFCAPSWLFFSKVALPATLPFILAGIRLAIGRALTGVVVAEFFLGNSGLGHFVQVESSNLNMDDAMAGIAILATAAVLLNVLVGHLERRFMHWGGAK